MKYPNSVYQLLLAMFGFRRFGRSNVGYFRIFAIHSILDMRFQTVSYYLLNSYMDIFKQYSPDAKYYFGAHLCY